jgi:hypothetical protein
LIGLDRKWFPATNALAFCRIVTDEEKKWIMTLTQEINAIKSIFPLATDDEAK